MVGADVFVYHRQRRWIHSNRVSLHCHSLLRCRVNNGKNVEVRGRKHWIRTLWFENVEYTECYRGADCKIPNIRDKTKRETILRYQNKSSPHENTQEHAIVGMTTLLPGSCY